MVNRPFRVFGRFVQEIVRNSQNMHTGNVLGSVSKPTLTSDGPMAGYRILDLTRVLAGPFCTMLLGDLGADVIKVEAPGHGDDSRNWLPPYAGSSHSCYFVSCNRNKKSIVVNLKSDHGRNIVRKLAAKSDVFIENYVPGKLDSLGLGYEDLKQVCPNIIYCSITGFGPTGPLSQAPGYDVIAAGYAGLLDITGPEDGEPCKVGIGLTDISTGLYAHGAILAAILERRRTGKGQKIDCSLLATQVILTTLTRSKREMKMATSICPQFDEVKRIFLTNESMAIKNFGKVSTLTNVASMYLNAGIVSKRCGTSHSSIVPYQAYKTSDGYVVIGIGNEPQFQNFCTRMSLEELSTDSRFKNNALRCDNRDALNELLTKRFLEKSTRDWLKTFEGAQFPRGPINTIEDVFNEPQVLHNKMVVEVEHPEHEKIKLVGPAVQFENGGNYCRSPPPLLGEHTDIVLQDILGMNAEEIQKLKSEGICQ